MKLTANAKARLKLAQENGLYLEDTESSICNIILEQEIVTECSSRYSCQFNVSDLDAELKDLI